MRLDKIKIPKDQDARDAILPVYAVELAKERARAQGLPLYYLKDGFLVEERRGKIKKLERITRNEFYEK